MTRAVNWGVRVLYLLAIAVGLFDAWELAGLDPSLPWHTISYWSQQSALLFWAILVSYPAAAIVLALWWWRHIHGGRISK